MARDIFAPGVTRESGWRPGMVVYVGELDALRGAGLVPEGIEKKGNGRYPSWQDGEGRRCTLTQGGLGPNGHARLRVTRYETARVEEAIRRAERDDERSRARLREIEGTLKSWSDSRSQFRYELARCVDLAFASLGVIVWSDSTARGPWVMKDSERGRFDEIRRAATGALYNLTAEFDPTWRANLEAERDMLITADCGSVGIAAGTTGLIERIRLQAK